MSRLLVQTLDTAATIYQTVVPTENINVRAIYLGLYVANTPGGTIALKIQDSNGNTIQTSSSVTVADMSTLAYAHGLFRFDITTPLKNGQTYRLALTSAGGYTADSTNFVGWKRDFDWTVEGLRRTPATYSNARGYNSPFDYLVISKENIRKGQG